MKYYVTAQSNEGAIEVLSLLRAYASADYGIEEMGYSVTLGFDTDDLRRYTHTDQMPVRIKSKLYPVSEDSASCIATTALLMLQMRSSGFSDPRAICIGTLEYVTTALQSRRTVSITVQDARRGEMLLSAPAAQSQVYHIDPVMCALLALKLVEIDLARLRWERADLVPV